MMKIKAIGDKIVVKLEESESMIKTKSGIVIQGTTNSAIYEKGLEVIGIGRKVSGIKIGDKVVVDGKRLEKFNINGSKYASIRHFEILGKVHGGK